MRNLLSAAVASLAALLLSGCFVSDKPIFNAKTAAHPFPAGTKYVQYHSDDKGWSEDARGVVAIKNGWYIITSKGKDADVMTFLLLPWGKNYIAEIKTENDKKKVMYMYGVLTPTADGFLEYGAECSKFDPAALQKKGLITYKTGEEDACHPTSLEALKTLMQIVLASNPTADNKYVIVK